LSDSQRRRVADSESDSMFSQLASTGTGLVRFARALPGTTALLERFRESRGGHPAEEKHDAHLHAALDWIACAQDATSGGGIARGYSLTWHLHFRRRGWQPAYPETTGYIIPTLLRAARDYGRPELKDRAVRAAQWEVEIQMESGAVRGGVIGEEEAPAVFNTGQVMLGWMAAHEATGNQAFAEAAVRAAKFLLSCLDDNGHWRGGRSLFASPDSTLYNARTAWALAEAGVRYGESAFVEGARRNLSFVADMQHADGWLPACCLSDPEHPLLHTIAYAVRGLLEGGRVLKDDRLVRAAILAAERLAASVRADGWMPGRFATDWWPWVEWSCLTGEAQMANNWMRLWIITGDERWLEPVPRVLRFLKRTQNRTTKVRGLRGGIKGSWPISGDYGRFEVLAWATKYFADALMRHDATARGRDAAAAADHTLA